MGKGDVIGDYVPDQTQVRDLGVGQRLVVEASLFGVARQQRDRGIGFGPEELLERV